MAENRERGIQHLTSLDLDVSGVIASLEEAKKQIEQYSIESGIAWKEGFQKSIAELSQDTSSVKTPVLDSENIQKTQKEVDKLTESYRGLSKVVERFDKSGTPKSMQETYDYGVGKQIVENYKYIEDVYELQSSRHIDNIKKRELAEQKARQKEISTIQITSKQLSNLADKYDTLAIRAKRAGQEGIASQAQETSKAIRDMASSVQAQSVSVDNAKENLEQYGRELVVLKNKFIESGAASESFLKRLKDKASWLSAYYLINQLGQIFKDTVQIIKGTEDAVIELQRVLNEDISETTMSDELYNIAYEYGRTFEEVSEVATKFAQSGENWNDTLELTRGTMLALNTAELDVTQSTQGLIAILAQWNLEAEDYQGVIDKINTTADHFAVTSENIVSALQRASSSAKNANISLEETIGIITAMAEATGRSGENIGTALNSLIIYTSKAKSLEVFAGMSDQMDELVKKYRSGTASIFEVWKGLSDEIKGLSAQQQETILKMTDYEQFADELESEASEYTDKIKETYETAGSYRQNYFIALLQDMEKAQQAIDNMTDSEGYSLSENEKYMKSLTANWNQLKSAIAELAVQVGQGEFGLLNIMKGAVSAATALVKLQKSLGGVLPLLTGIGSALIIINAQKMSEKVSDFTSSLKSTITAMTATKNRLLRIKSANDSVAASNATVQASFGWIGIIGVALSTAVMAFNGFNSAIEETNRKARESASANMDEAESIESLKEEYAEIVKLQDGSSEKIDRLTKFKENLIKTYKEEKDAINSLNGARSDEIDFLDKEYTANVRSAYHDIIDQYEEAVKKIEGGPSTRAITILSNADVSVIDKYVDKVQKIYDYNGRIQYSIDFGTSSLIEQNKIIDYILSNVKLEAELEYQLKELRDENSENISKYSSQYKDYVDTVAKEYLLRDEIQNKIKEINNTENLEEQKRLYDAFVDDIKENVVGEKAQAVAIENVGIQLGFVEEKAKATGAALENAFGSQISNQISAIETSLESLNKNIDSFQSKYDTLISAVEEFNQNGYLSVDTIQALISAGGEYISLLEYTANGIQLNKERTDILLASQSNNINAMIQQAATADVLRIVEKYLGDEVAETANKEDNASQSANNLSANVQTLASSLVSGTITLNEFNNELARMANQAGRVIDTRAMSTEITNALNGYNDLIAVIGNLAVNNAAWSKSAGSAAKSQTDALKKELEAQKKAIKERYDAEIQALKDIQAENDRLAKQEEYYRKRRDYLNDIEKAATRSGIEYREQESEARRKLEELDRDWQETVEKWSIEDQIKELEALRDAEIAAIDAQIEKITATTSAAIGGVVNSSSQANTLMLDNYTKDYLQPALKESKESFEKTAELFPKYMDEAHKRVLNMTKQNATEMSRIYKDGFFNPMMNMLNQIKTDSIKAISFLPSSITTPFIQNPLTSSTTNNTNNTTNANMYANMFVGKNVLSQNFFGGFVRKP